MSGLVKNELYKAFRLRKLYLFMGAVLALQGIKIFQYKFTGQGEILFPLNGQSFPLEMIENNTIIMVMFIAVLAADMLAEEYRNGNYKPVLLRPVSRIQFVGAKAAALLASITAIVCFTVITSYMLGAIAFGWGNHLLFQGVPVAGNSIAVTLRAAMASILPGAGFGMLVLFIALMTGNTGITIGSAMALFFISPLLERYGTISEYSILYLMNAFPKIFINNTTPAGISGKLGVIAVYIALFYAGSAIMIKRKDILL